MKISGISPEKPIFITNTQVQSKEVGISENNTGTSMQANIQVLLDNQVKQMLSELTKMLNQQTELLKEVPSFIQDEAGNLLTQSSASDEILPQGLAALYKGQKNVAPNLLNLAGSLEDAAFLSQNIPKDSLASLNSFLATYQDNTTDYNDITKTVLNFAAKLADKTTQVITANDVLLHTARTFLDNMPREELAVARQDLKAKLPELLNSFIAEFSKDLSSLTTLQGRDFLINTLRQSSKELINDLNVTPKNISGLPSLMDDLISIFENKLNKGAPVLDKDLIIGDIRQTYQKLLQELSPDIKNSIEKLLTNAKLQELVPDSLKQVAIKHNLPEFTKTWLIQKLVNSGDWMAKPPESLQQAGQVLKEMATVIQRTNDLPNDTLKNQNTFNLLIPLYLGEERKPYPTYIQVYQDKEGRSSAGEEYVPETWLRLCIATENIGMVDMVFHIFGKNQLNIKVNFDDINIAEQFKDNIVNVWSNLDNMPLNLSEITVNGL